jgi:LRR receptor-like serine/threonine-protein kinase FLS2
LTNLQYLLLGGNDITSIPSDWSSLTQLRVVELSGNSRLAGTLPVSLFDLPKLHTLRIQGTQMHGPLPPIGGAPLTELRLGHNELSGMLPSSLALLTGLTDLGLEGNRLHGPLPEEVFGSMPRLAELNLSSQFSRSGFTGTLPAALWTMSDLRVLDLHSNSLEGPLGIRDKSDDDSLQSLSVLNLASNRLTGPLPSHLASLPMLQYVYLNDNNLNGEHFSFSTPPPK